MKTHNKITFREIVESLPDSLLTITTGLYTDVHKKMLKGVSTIEEYISKLGTKYENINAPLLLKDLEDRKKNNRKVYDEIVDMFNEQKRNLKEKDYNMKTSKEVQKTYKSAVKGVDSSDNWNEISNGAEKDREHYFKLHPELRKDKEEKKESFKKYLTKKLYISEKEAGLVESIVKEYIKKNKSMKEASFRDIKDVAKSIYNKLKNILMNKSEVEDNSEYIMKYENLMQSRNGVEFTSVSDLASFMAYAFPVKGDDDSFNYDNYDIESKRNALKLFIPDNLEMVRKKNENIIYKSLIDREGESSSYRINVVNDWKNKPLIILKKIS